MYKDKLKAPITLISHGRSGTSLLQNIFDAHPDISVAGETADLIFGTWYSISKIKGIVPGLFDENGKLVPWEERVALGVRAVFDQIFNLDRKYWMQKPISQPFIMQFLKMQEKNEKDWFNVYWSVLDQVFPEGKFITILREPRDVVLSSKEYWGRDHANVWGNIATMARCIAHESSKVNYAVSFDELVQEPEPTLKKLFAHIDVPYSSDVLAALEHIYVPDQKKWKQDKSLFEDKIKRGFSRQKDWKDLDMSIVKTEDLEAIEKLWNKFGYSLNLN
ncbi:sulfotransferase [Okeania sp.]|uniref:sulfotransferase family protein n=1 Tax=Okeania sp. TaxID=3100323 RepID=UPI002B4AC0CF|nr:sulfotransferase [Okeania sp.]MEB3340211.1 sulfotransferase [Okeania sp.]